MGFEVNRPNNVFGVNQVSNTSQVKGADFLNTVFGKKNGNYIQTPFSGEEQHILGIFANVQNNILIED